MYDSPWLLVERSFTKKSRKLKPGTWVFKASWWNVIKALWLYEIVRVSLFSLTRIGIWLTRLSIHWQRCHFQSLWKFAELSRKDFLLFLKIKYFLGINYQTLIVILCVFIITHTLFRVNLHFAVAWMSRNSLLETGAISQV